MSTNNGTFFGCLASRSRKKLREKENLRLFLAFVRDFTAIDVNQQMDTESDYLFEESKSLNCLLTKDDMLLLDVKDQIFRVLGRLAINLPECYRKDIVIMPFEDLMRGYDNYLNNPKNVKKNQIPRFEQELIVDIALDCLTWSCAHIASEMNKLGFEEIKEHHVQNVLTRNFIPMSDKRMNKGFSWKTFVELLKWLNNTQSYFDENDRRTKTSQYYKMHKRLTDFIDNIKLNPELVARNLYARLENDILREMCNRKNIRITKDKERELARKVLNIKGVTQKVVSLLSTWQIVAYSKETFGQKYSKYVTGEKKSASAIRKEERQNELRTIIDSHPNWGRTQIYKAMLEKFKGITFHQVNDMLYDIGFWDTKRTVRVIRWKDWIKKIEHVTWAGDFFVAQVFTTRGPKTYYVFFCIHLETDEMFIGGISSTASAEWLKNTIKRWTEPVGNPLNPYGPDARYLIRDRDRRYTKEVDWYIAQLGMMPIEISPGAPVMNCHAESFVNRIRRECLDLLFFFSENALFKVLDQYATYYNEHRPNRKHDGRSIVENKSYGKREGKIERVDLIPGILIYFHRVLEKEAA